jgi:ribosome-binding protein aMBF1 (putative translation factor)
MDENVKMMIIQDHELEGLSYRNLAEKYGINRTDIHRIVMSKMSKNIQKPRLPPQAEKAEASLPDDVNELKKALRDARLTIELQELMLDIASKELGVDIRKKSGTKQSK